MITERDYTRVLNCEKCREINRLLSGITCYRADSNDIIDTKHKILKLTDELQSMLNRKLEWAEGE